MMYDVDKDFERKERADGSKEYPAVSCRVLKEFNPEMPDG